MTDDEVFALAEACGWGSAKRRKRQMTPGDAAAWCDQMRAFAAIERRRCAGEIKDMADLVFQTGGSANVASSLRTAASMLIEAHNTETRHK